MTIIYSDDSAPISWPTTDSHDPNSKKYYYIDYRPVARANSTAYTKGLDVIVPSVFNGCMYECISGGTSAAVEPTFTTDEGKIITDGDVKWKCKPYSARLGIGDTITVSTWTGDTGVTTSNPLIISNIVTGVRVDAVPTGVKKFNLTNHITILRVSGKTEEFEKTLVITIKEL